MQEQLRSSVHIPLRLELVAQRRLREDHIAGKTADTASSATEGTQIGRGDTTPITSDTACITHRVGVLELLRRCKVQVCEGI